MGNCANPRIDKKEHLSPKGNRSPTSHRCELRTKNSQNSGL